MINGFNDENKTEELNIEVDQNEKNKADGSNKTILNVTQKRRIANIANVLFDDNAKKFFETDFENHLKKIEDIELEQTKEAVNIIKEEAEEEVKKKKNKKKTSFKKRIRQFRMVSHLLKFITDIYNNFKKFGKESNSIIQRHFYDKGFTIRGVLTDKNERDRFVLELKEAIEEVAYSFYYNIFVESIQPTIELFVKLATEQVLIVFDKIHEAIEAAGDELEDMLENYGIKHEAKKRLKNLANKLKGKNISKNVKASFKTIKTVKNQTKLAKTLKTIKTVKTTTKAIKTAKTAVNVARAAEVVAVGGAAGAAETFGISLIIAGIIEGALWAWTAYNAAEITKAVISMLHGVGELSLEIAEHVERAMENFEGLENIEDLIYKFSLNGEDLLKALRNDKEYANKKVNKFIDLYETYNDNIDLIIKNFNNSKNFEEDEIIALKLKNLNSNDYYPQLFVISKWASFFKDFIDKFSLLMKNVNSELLLALTYKNDIVQINYNEATEKIINIKPIPNNSIEKIKNNIVDKLLTLLYKKSRKFRLNKEKLSTLKNCLTVVKVKTLLNKPVR